MSQKEKEQNKEEQQDLHEEVVSKTESELEKLQHELEEEKNARIQLLSDFVNYRKRSERDKEELHVSANKLMIMQIIDIVDDFERAITSDNEKVDMESEFYQGVLLIKRKLSDLLTSYGLEEIPATVGGDFDPATMEALTTAPVEDKKLTGKVIHVSGKGYKNKNTGMVFKPVRVITGK